MEGKINGLPIDLQDTLTGTSAIAGGKTRSNVTHRIELNGNGKHGAQNITKKLQKSCLRLQHTDEEMKECSFLEAERFQRKGDTVLKNGQSDGGGPRKSTESPQMEILK